jgi:hypothetical protein
MEKGDRQRSGPEQVAGSREPQRAQRPAPGKVTRTSKLAPGRGPAVQRRATAADGAPSRSRSLWDHTMDPWMDAAHRGAQALVQAKPDSGVTRDEPVPRASGSGQAMPAQVQAKMEQAFETDFSAVRIHQGPQAASLGARAYTQGTDIHFQPGLYQPESQQGQELLGHELTHVVQQSQGRVQAMVQARGVGINDDDALEREADRMGAAAARGESAGRAAGGASSPAASAQDGSVQRKPSRGSAEVVQMDGGFWDTLQRGAGIYLGITLQDEGSPYAKALMRHYVLGGGGEFNPETSSINFPTDGMWSSFMAGRPEIQRAMEAAFRTEAATAAGGSTTSGHIATSITDVRLNELESMRWTLHGCHRIEIEMDYSVSDDGAGNKTVTFTNMHFRWIDVGDMHPGTVTETDSGELVDDADLMGAGSSFPINIPFAAPGSSVWQVSGGTASHSSGWPNAGTATSTRYRGEG